VELQGDQVPCVVHWLQPLSAAGTLQATVSVSGTVSSAFLRLPFCPQALSLPFELPVF